MEITKDVIYIGVNDHRVDLFEGQYQVPKGISYNSYVIMDEKIAVMDTVDAGFDKEWLDNLNVALNGRRPDYLVVLHMEPDHAANIQKFMEKYPEAVLVGNAKTFTMIQNFFRNLDTAGRTLVVANGDTLSLGTHELSFVFAPMVHWPEVMVAYESRDKILFSADGFGKFGALDEADEWDDEARRYFIGIVGKYGNPVQMLLKKAAALDIEIICPLHGPVLSENLSHYIGLYDTWSSYSVEKKGVVIAYSSVYGHTKEAALLLEKEIKAISDETVVVYDLARCDMHRAVSDAFCYDTLVLASMTYNGDVFPHMRTFVEHLLSRDFQKRNIALMENGSWAPMAAKVIQGMFEKSKEINYIGNPVKIMSSINDVNVSEIKQLAEMIKNR